MFPSRWPAGSGSVSVVEDRKAPWTEHLEELRLRLFRALVVSGVVGVVLLSASDFLMKLLIHPLGDLRPHTFALEEAFLVRMKASFFATFLVLLPYYLLEFWGFVKPGLYPHERRWVGGGLLAAVVLAYLGLLFAWGAFLPLSVRALQQFLGDTFVLTLRADNYLKFFFWTALAAMALFEMPLVFAILARLGLLDPEQIARNRRGWLITLVTLLAIITPSVDMVSLILVTVPLWVLFEISLQVARAFVPKEASGEDEAPPRTLES